MIFESKPSDELINKLSSKYSIERLITISDNFHILPGQFPDLIGNDFKTASINGTSDGYRVENNTRIRLTKEVYGEYGEYRDHRHFYSRANQSDFANNTQVVTQENVSSWALDRIDQRSLPLSDSYSYVDPAGSGVDVYIIDTGIDITNPEFENRASWGITTIANADNADNNGHGTFVAGIVGSKTYGVAKKCNLIAVKSLNGDGIGDLGGMLSGLEYVVTQHKKANGARRSIANLSVGSSYDRIINRAITEVINQGILVIVAAGNGDQTGRGVDACSESPASADSAITVGATTMRDEIAVFSNYGSCVDVFAPGVSILSTSPGRIVTTKSGTSFSAPVVSGIAALAMSDETKTLSPQEIKNSIVRLATRNVIKNLGVTNSPNLLAYSQVQNIDHSGGAASDRRNGVEMLRVIAGIVGAVGIWILSGG